MLCIKYFSVMHTVDFIVYIWAKCDNLWKCVCICKKDTCADLQLGSWNPKDSKGMKRTDTQTRKLGPAGTVLILMEDTYYHQQPGASVCLLGTAGKEKLASVGRRVSVGEQSQPSISEEVGPTSPWLPGNTVPVKQEPFLISTLEFEGGTQYTSCPFLSLEWLQI